VSGGTHKWEGRKHKLQPPTSNFQPPTFKFQNKWEHIKLQRPQQSLSCASDKCMWKVRKLKSAWSENMKIWKYEKYKNTSKKVGKTSLTFLKSKKWWQGVFCLLSIQSTLVTRHLPTSYWTMDTSNSLECCLFSKVL
jgi:hypothetical protein